MKIVLANATDTPVVGSGPRMEEIEPSFVKASEI